MQLTLVERIILLKLTQILEVIDPGNAAQHDADAQALELGDERGIARLFDVIDLEPPQAAPRRPALRIVSSVKEGVSGQA
jgi:hypothetical protein